MLSLSNRKNPLEKFVQGLEPQAPAYKAGILTN